MHRIGVNRQRPGHPHRLSLQQHKPDGHDKRDRHDPHAFNRKPDRLWFGKPRSGLRQNQNGRPDHEGRLEKPRQRFGLAMAKTVIVIGRAPCASDRHEVDHRRPDIKHAINHRRQKADGIGHEPTGGLDGNQRRSNDNRGRGCPTCPYFPLRDVNDRTLTHVLQTLGLQFPLADCGFIS